MTEDLFLIVQKSYDEAKPTGVWDKFYFPIDENAKPEKDSETSTKQAAFERFKADISADEKLTKLRNAIKKAFIDIDENGLLKGLEHGVDKGNLHEIEVYDKGNFEGGSRVVKVSDVRIAEIADTLRNRLTEEISNESETITRTQVCQRENFRVASTGTARDAFLGQNSIDAGRRESCPRGPKTNEACGAG